MQGRKESRLKVLACDWDREEEEEGRQQGREKEREQQGREKEREQQLPRMGQQSMQEEDEEDDVF